MKRSFVAVAALVALSQVAAVRKPEGDQFYVYQDYNRRIEHYIPSGYMGDYGDIKIQQRWEQKPASGKYCIQVKYTAERKQQAGWAGVYWQDPANNWGTMKGGWDLGSFTKVVFKARGETGKEYIEKFMIGGITGQGENGDSGSADSGAIELSKEWKEYSVPFDGADFSETIGGFGFVLSADSNMNGAVFYLDDIRFEK